MNEDLSSEGSPIVRIQQLEKERDALQNDIEQLCMHQAGPSYVGVAARLHFQRTAGLEEEIDNLRKKLAVYARDNKNLQEEISEAYRIKSQLADLHNAEVLKNMEAEKQLKYFQSCVAAAFAERDTAIMEAQKAKENEVLMPQELKNSQIRIDELASELLKEKEQVKIIQGNLEKQENQHEVFREIINKFYHIRQGPLETLGDVSQEDKCDCLLRDSAAMWKFENNEETSTSIYVSSLEAEIETLRNGVDNLQNKLRVGLEIESHLKKKFKDLEKSKFLTEEKIKQRISALVCFHSQYRIGITNLLAEWHSELKSLIDLVIEKVKERELIEEHVLASNPTQDVELSGCECRDVHINADSNPTTVNKIVDPGFPIPNTTGIDDFSEALAQALQEKVEVLLLLSQQEERHLLERNVNAALQKKIEELKRNLLQVTNEKVKALIELAHLKQEQYALQEKINKDGEQRIPREKDGKLKNFLKGNYIRRWVGSSETNNAEAWIKDDKNVSQIDFARMWIENATFKESLESMEHLLSSIRRLRISLLKVKDSVTETSDNSNLLADLDKIMAEAKLVKVALGSSLPISCSAETDESQEKSDDGSDPGLEKIDFVTAAGFEMVNVLTFAAHILKEHISSKVELKQNS